MTRHEFIEECTTWNELTEACSDRNLDFCVGIYDSGEYSDEIDNELSEKTSHDSWEVIRDWLDGLPDPENSYWFVKDGFGDWNTTEDGDDWFEDAKAEFIDYMDDNELWDEEEDDDANDEDEVEERYVAHPIPEEAPLPPPPPVVNEPPLEQESITVDELVLMCNNAQRKLEKDAEPEEPPLHIPCDITYWQQAITAEQL